MPVSVVLPCYNCDQYIGEAIQSILNQTYRDFELIIIDDGSTDQTTTVIRSFNDNRIRLINKEQNQGLVDSLNRGLELAQFDYIAIMHGDDIASQDRLEEQVLFMETHPEIICCGSWINILGTEKVIQYPANSDEVHVGMLDGNIIAHPTVMLKTNTIKSHHLQYNPEYHYGAEDYEFWQQLMKVGRITNIPKVLLQYRLHNSQKSELYKQRIIAYTEHIRTRFLNDVSADGHYEQFLGNYPLASHKTFTYTDFETELDQLSNLKRKNNLQQAYDLRLFNAYIHLKEFYLVRAFLVHHLSFSNILRTSIFHPGSLLRTLLRKLSLT
jgi:glycosyltransferase involved in cell wall biosynthesis